MPVLRTRIVGDFDQIHVGITKIHRHHHPSGAVSFYRTSDRAHAARIQVGNNVRNGEGSNKANVGRARGGLFCYQGTLASELLQIDLLASEGQSFSTGFAKGNYLHAQHFGIEITSCTNIFDGQNDVVDAVDLHELPPAAQPESKQTFSPRSSRRTRSEKLKYNNFRIHRVLRALRGDASSTPLGIRWNITTGSLESSTASQVSSSP